MPIFLVHLERVESCEVTVEGPSEELVQEAVEADEWCNYNFDESKSITTHSVPQKLADKAKPEAYVVVELGAPTVLDPDQYKDWQKRRETLPPEEVPSPPDTLTLSLFPEDKR